MSKHGGIEKSFNNNGYLYSRVTRRLRADTRDYGEVRVATCVWVLESRHVKTMGSDNGIGDDISGCGT